MGVTSSTLMNKFRTDPMPNIPLLHQGKVRDVYDLGDKIILVTSDRISAFDHVLTPSIPDKGKILN